MDKAVEKRFVAVMVDPTLHRDLRVAAIDRDTTMRAVVIDALRQYLQSDETPGPTADSGAPA